MTTTPNWGPWKVQRTTGRTYVTRWYVQRECSGKPYSETVTNERGATKKFKSEAAAQATCDKANAHAPA